MIQLTPELELQLIDSSPQLKYRSTVYKLGVFLDTEGLSIEGIFECDSFSSVDSLVWDLKNYGSARLRFNVLEDDQRENASCLNYDLEFVALGDVTGILKLDFAFIEVEKPYVQIPGVIYGDEMASDSRSIQPKLCYKQAAEYPYVNRFHTRADRSSHNAIIVQGRDLIALNVSEAVEVGTDPDGFVENGIYFDFSPDTQLNSIGVSLGYEHFPKLYRGKLGPDSTSSGPVSKHFYVRAGESIASSGYLFLSPVESAYAHEKAVEFLYGKLHQHPNNSVDLNESTTSIARAIAEDAFFENHSYFPTVMSGSCPDTGAGGDMAWTGGMQVVYPLVRAFREYPQGVKVVEQFIDSLTIDGINSSSGLFFESKREDEWTVHGWWSESIQKHHSNVITENGAHSAYVNGQAICYILKTVQFLKSYPQAGIKIATFERWSKVALKILSQVTSQQREDGAYGIYYDPNRGDALLWDGCQGLWFLAAVAEAYKLTGKECYKRSFDHGNAFYEKYLKAGCLWGMPMDTGDAPDEECALPYITALKTMHESTGDIDYLALFVHVLHYEFSWKFAYNTRHRNSPLKEMNWSSSGGCITSSHNIHIHQMGNLVVDEIYYAWQQTGNEYFLNRLKDTLNWGLGTCNSGDQYFGFGKDGWATEQFFHSDGVQDDPTRVPNGGIWPDFLCWASACVLLSNTADIPEEFYLPNVNP